jgi:hypothetical protein
VRHDGTGDGVFACECPNECAESIELPISDYVSVRGHPTRFIVVYGHEDERIERVVDTDEAYLVVEKPMAPQSLG